MEDDEDIEEESDLDIPGIPDDSSSQIVIKSPSKASKAQSKSSTPLQSVKSPSILSETKQKSPIGSPSIQTSKELEEPLEEKLSKSQEELRRSQDISLNGKKTSLDQLSNIQKSKVTKMYRQCHRHFRELIGKRELKNEELEKQQGDLKQRLNILECSMPAVMVWNIWRMTQGSCVPNLKRVMEKQFQGPASGEVYCPSTPSRHFDCRVREVEAERKQAQKRVEEARSLWSDKAATLEDKNKRLQEAKKIHEETMERIQQLTLEAQRLKEAASKVEDDGACETGECGVIECKKKWLEKIPSSASIKSTDIECLEKLQQLAENEVYTKRQIADLERREEAYMKTLQQADELWCKLEGDAASTMSALQEQLDMKTSANQQMADRIVELEDVIEQLRARLATCRGELEKYMSVSKIEALIGKDDDFADVLDKGVLAGVELRDEMIGRDDDLAGVYDIGVLSKEAMQDRDMLAMAEMADADSLMKPDMADLAMGVYRGDLEGLRDAQMGIHPDDFAYEDERLLEARDYLARLGSLSELDKYGDDYVCAPDFACNDLVLTETGLTEEEMIALRENRITARELLEQSGVAVDVDVVVAKREEVQEGIPTDMMRTLPAEGAPMAAKVAELEELVELDEESGASSAEGASVVDVEKERRSDVLVEESAPGEEFEPSEDTGPVEEFKDYEDVAPTEEFKDSEDTGLTEEFRDYEDTSPTEEFKDYEDTSATEEFKDYEDTGPAEEFKDYEDTAPVEEPESRMEDTSRMEEGKPVRNTDPTLEIDSEGYVKTEREEPVVAERTKTPKDTVDRNNIVVPRNEMLSWQDDVDSIRTTIAKCPECVGEKKNADNLAEMMAAYTETEVKEIIAQPKPREKVVAEEPKETEVQAKPEVAEVETTAAPKVEEKEVDAKVMTKPLTFEEVKVETEHPRKSPITPLQATVSEKPEGAPTAEVARRLEEETLPDAIKEPAKEPGKMPTIAEEAEEPALPIKGKDLPEAAGKEITPLQEGVKEKISPGEEKGPPDAVEKEKVEEPSSEGMKKEIPPEEKEEKIVEEREEFPTEDKVVAKIEVSPEKEEAEVKTMAKEEAGKEELVPDGIKEEEAPAPEEIKEEEVPVPEGIKKEEAPLPEEKVALPGKEDEEEKPIVEEEVLPVEFLPEEGEEIEKEPAEVKEPEEEEIEVPLDIKEEIPEEEEIEVAVEVLSEEEEIEVAVEVLPEEEAEVEPKEVEEEKPVEEEVSKEEMLEEPDVCVTSLSDESEEEFVIPCTCLLPPPEPTKKIEITQTEITRIETVQVVTQTVVDVETQTTPRITRQSEQPKLVTITRAVDPDSETMQRLLSFGKPLKEQSAVATVAESSQTSSFRMRTMNMGGPPQTHPLASILQSLRTEGATVKPTPEQEIRSIYYGKKSGDLQEGKCNCCQCGKMVSSSIPGSRVQMEAPQPVSMFKILSGLPSRKIGSPSTDQAVQHDTLCPECKLRKLQVTLKSQDHLKKLPKKSTRDQQVCTCVPQITKPQAVPRLRRKSDQSCMAKIPKAKTDRMSRREMDRMETEKDEDQESVHCACSGLIETKKGTLKMVHCACGDPD